MTVQEAPIVVAEVPASTAPMAQPDRAVTPALAARQETITTDRRTGSVGPGASVAVVAAWPTSMRTLEHALACLAIASAVLIRAVR